MSDAIEYLKECVKNNCEADYSDRPEKRLDALSLRNLVLRVKSPSIRVRGATIFGVLDLSWCGSGQAPLAALCFNDCRFVVDGDESVNAFRPNLDLSYAHIGALSLAGSKITHLRAVSSRVHGPVDLSSLHPLVDSDEALCWCKLSRSIVEGDVMADGVRLRAPQSVPEGFCFSNMFEWDWALNLCASRIDGSVMSRDAPGECYPFIAGGILLDAATVGGDIYLRAATVAGHPKRAAISLERVRITGSLTLAGTKGSSGEFKCCGAIRMMRSEISGSFDVYGACLAPTGGIALYAVGAIIGGWCTLGQRPSGDDRTSSVYAAGRLWFHDIQVAGRFEITNVRVDLCDQGVDSWFAYRELNGPVALDVSSACIDGTISLNENEFSDHMDFRDARCASLYDSPSGYNGAKYIFLDGFRYGRIDNTGWKVDKTSVQSRLHAWLPGEPGKLIDQPRSAYRPQPFIQLASVLAAHGDESGAWTVLSKKALFDAKLRWKLQPWFRSLLYWPIYVAVRAYGLCFDFGLSPPRALATLLLLIALGAGLFGWMDYRNAMVVAQMPVASWVVEGNSPKFAANTTVAAVSSIACGLTRTSPEQPVFVAKVVILGRLLVYAADVFVPLVDMREETKCDVGEVEGATPCPQLWEVTLYRFAKALYATLGWVLTTLALVTFSGVVRHRLVQD